MEESWNHEFVKADGIRMHYVIQGEGRLLLLLHGFPDFWYVWRFQIPELAKHFRVVAPDLRGYTKPISLRVLTDSIPEEVLSRNDYSFLKNMLRRSFVRKGVLADEDLKAYAEAWSKPGALTAAINYYRANMNPSILFSERKMVFPKIKSPTLVIWGEQDVALSKI